MGCNCGKDSIPLSLKQKLRREAKEKFAKIRELWQESADENKGGKGKVTSNKDELGFH